MTERTKNIVEDYISWLRAGISTEEIGEAREVTTPFLDRHNDHLQLYVVPRDGEFQLTDDGYILADLHASGLDVNTPKRRAVLLATLNGFGVREDRGQLVLDASPKNIGQRMHSLIQAMLAVNDMFVLAQPRVAGFFFEDVRDYLAEHSVRFVERVKLTGRSGYDHGIDFLIPPSSDAPERILQAINYPTKNTIGAYLFALNDTKAGRSEDARAYAFLNDTKREVGPDISDALLAYSVNPVHWSHRDEALEELSA